MSGTAGCCNILLVTPASWGVMTSVWVYMMEKSQVHVQNSWGCWISKAFNKRYWLTNEFFWVKTKTTFVCSRIRNLWGRIILTNLCQLWHHLLPTAISQVDWKNINYFWWVSLKDDEHVFSDWKSVDEDNTGKFMSYRTCMTVMLYWRGPREHVFSVTSFDKLIQDGRRTLWESLSCR